MIKTLRELELEGNFLNLIKAISEKATSDIMHTGEKLEPWKISKL